MTTQFHDLCDVFELSRLFNHLSLNIYERLAYRNKAGPRKAPAVKPLTRPTQSIVMESIPSTTAISSESEPAYAAGLRAFVEVDRQLVVTGVSQRGAYRYSALLADAEGQPLTELLPLPEQLRQRSLGDALLQRDSIWFVPLLDERETGDGSESDRMWICSEPVLSPEGHLTGIRVHLLNVTLDDHDADVGNDAHDEYVRFEERRALARRLHDGPRQLLSAAALRLGLLINDSETNEKAYDELKRIAELVDQARDEMRVNLVECDPSEPDRRISTILHDVAERFNTTMTLHVTDSLPDIHAHIQRALSRTAREAVVNGLKHSDGQNIHVVLSAEDTEISIIVKDDGYGFDAASVLTTSAGIGLQLMGAQATAVGGICELSSSQGHGTTIRADLPLRPPDLQPFFSASPT